MTLTKAHTAESIHNKPGLPRSSCVQLLESALEIMKGALANGEEILISGFGKFSVKDKKQRRGRNPQTGQDLMLQSRKTLVFKCFGLFGNKINGWGLTGNDPSTKSTHSECGAEGSIYWNSLGLPIRSTREPQILVFLCTI